VEGEGTVGIPKEGMDSVPNDDEESSCLGSDGSKKPRSDPILLTPEQEEDVVSWYQDHPLLYNNM